MERNLRKSQGFLTKRCLITSPSGEFVAGALISPAELAHLAVAQRTAGMISFILVAINFVVAPRFAALDGNRDTKEIKSLAFFSIKLMLLFALPILLAMLLFPALILSIFGKGFSTGAPLLQILAVGQFINVVTGSVGYLLMMTGHEKDMRNIMLISGPLAIALALILTSSFGAIGSATATAISLSTQNLLVVWYVKKRLGFNTLHFWQKV